MSRADRWAGAVFLLLGILVVIETHRLDYGSGYGAGPGFFPFWLGGTIALLGAILLLKALRRPNATEEDSVQATQWRKKIIAYGALLAFVLTVEIVGFITGFALLFAFLLVVIEREGWLRSILAALTAGAGLYLLFVRLLQVKLPSGLLGF
ncbi:MAG: tripartite tricarboxylate transporter TctB family protein [Candidatus Binatia bacterium]